MDTLMEILNKLLTSEWWKHDQMMHWMSLASLSTCSIVFSKTYAMTRWCIYWSTCSTASLNTWARTRVCMYCLPHDTFVMSFVMSSLFMLCIDESRLQLEPCAASAILRGLFQRCQELEGPLPIGYQGSTGHADRPRAPPCEAADYRWSRGQALCISQLEDS